MADITYGETTKTDEYTVYRVEVMWPDTSEDGKGHRKWGTYYRWAFNDHRNPVKGSDRRGSFETENADVSDVPERLEGRWWDSVAFSTPEAALAYAERVRLYAQPQCGWAGPETWREKYRQPCDARVVEERLAQISRIVESVA